MDPGRKKQIFLWLYKYNLIKWQMRLLDMLVLCHSNNFHIKYSQKANTQLFCKKTFPLTDCENVFKMLYRHNILFKLGRKYLGLNGTKK